LCVCLQSGCGSVYSPVVCQSTVRLCVGLQSGCLSVYSPVVCLSTVWLWVSLQSGCLSVYSPVVCQSTVRLCVCLQSGCGSVRLWVCVLPGRMCALPAACPAAAADVHPAAASCRAPSAHLCPGSRLPSCRSCRTQLSAERCSGCAPPPPSLRITLRPQHLHRKHAVRAPQSLRCRTFTASSLHVAAGGRSSCFWTSFKQNLNFHHVSGLKAWLNTFRVKTLNVSNVQIRCYYFCSLIIWSDTSVLRKNLFVTIRTSHWSIYSLQIMYLFYFDQTYFIERWYTFCCIFSLYFHVFFYIPASLCKWEIKNRRIKWTKGEI